ncbi:MAG TPA: HAMP domain-containing sensor histidine kinase [Candidatus Limnocylindrales bacterium]|nr:HAMP domain-containing sensor histidine kinase [Candidatus Limnocylindrales bacterium]
MDLSRPSLRLLALFGAVALPPLIGLAALINFAPEWVDQVGMGTALLLAAGGGAILAGVMAVAGSRAIGRDLSVLVELAERGSPGDATSDGLSAVQRRLAAALDERNHQIASLAAALSAVPITGTAVQVAASVVTTARQVTGDPTWQLAVLRVANPELLDAGVYSDDPSAAPEPVTDLHRWAASAEAPEGGDEAQRSRRANGPWGAFLVVDASAGDDLSAILFALWEGRAEPTRAEFDLFGLLGQQAATAIDHALLYAQVRRQADELNRMAAIQTDFLRGVTHDLQTPLTSIRALASELGQTKTLDDAARADLDTIAHQAERLRRMVSQLLVASRLEVGAVTPAQEVLRVEPIIRRTWEALRADRRFELVDDGPMHLVIADPDRLEQVLWAVLDNAVKYSPATSLVRVRLSASSVDSEAEQATEQLVAKVEISDEGAGMDNATRQRAFEQFYRSTDARRLAPDGSGVGLYAARGLMRAMGGDIAIQSRLGAGATITLTLPAERAAEGAGETGDEPSKIRAAVDAHEG